MVLPSHATITSNINTDFYNSVLKVPSRLHDRNAVLVDLSGRFDPTTGRAILDKTATNWSSGRDFKLVFSVSGVATEFIPKDSNISLTALKVMHATRLLLQHNLIMSYSATGEITPILSPIATGVVSINTAASNTAVVNAAVIASAVLANALSGDKAFPSAAYTSPAVGLAVNDLVVVIDTGQFGVVISTTGVDPTIKVGNLQADIPLASLGSLNTKLSLL